MLIGYMNDHTTIDHRSGVIDCCSDPPSTRAGGQDDVS